MSGPGPQQASKVPFDPGWNDPPPLSYSPQAQTSKPRTMLNKRVAFPLSSPPRGAATNALSPGMPPMPTHASQPVIPITPAQPLVPSIQESELTDFDSESALKEVTGVLYSILEESSELGSKAGDISKRIAVMESMWSSGQLSATVQYRMRELAIAMRAGQAAEADELHKALMVEQVAQVSAWMPGVRRLLHHHAARQDLLSLDRDDT